MPYSIYPVWRQVSTVFHFVFSSEVCPFCGKTYKRLKSHLPHCKAASRPNTPPISHEDAQRSSQHQINDQGDTRLQKLTVSAGPRSKKSKKVSAVSSQTAAQTGNSSSSQLASSASLPSSAGTKKQKLSEPVKAALVPPSTPSLMSKPQPPDLNTKRKTGQESLEAAGPRKGTRTAPKHLSIAQCVTQTDSAEPASQPTGSRGSSETKDSKKKATRAGSVTQNYVRKENIGKPGVRKKDLVTTERTIDDLSLNMESRNGLESKIILQNVKAVLGRGSTSPKSSRPSVLVQIQSSDPSSRITSSTSLSQAPLPTGRSKDQFLSTGSSSPSPPALRQAPASPLTPFPPGCLSSQGRQATMGLSAESPLLIRFSSTKLLPARVAHDGLVTEMARLEDRKPAISDSTNKG